MLVGLPCEEAVREEDIGEDVVPLPQQHLTPHGDFPLDRVKDYVLAWDDRATPHPRLFTTKADLDRFRKRFEVDDAALEKLRKTAIFGYSMDDLGGVSNAWTEFFAAGPALTAEAARESPGSEAD